MQQNLDEATQNLLPIRMRSLVFLPDEMQQSRKSGGFGWRGLHYTAGFPLEKGETIRVQAVVHRNQFPGKKDAKPLNII